MNLNHLAIFQATAASGSITGGAQRMHISQSAVSKQLAEFERALGLPLFDRLPRGVRMTQAGRVLLGYANRLFSLEEEAEKALRDLQHVVRGRIAIGASRTIGAYKLPAALAAFRRRYAEVELSLQVENTLAIETKLIANEIDIGFSEGSIMSDNLAYQVFAEDQLVLVAAPKYFAGRSLPISVATLAACPLITHEIGSGTRAVTEAALAAKGVAFRPTMVLASTEAIKQAVATGVGLAFLSSLTIQLEVAAKKLIAVPVRGLSINRPLYVVRLKHASVSPSLQAFLDILEISQTPWM